MSSRSKSKPAAKKQITEPYFSPAALKVARKALKDFERQSDEDFLVRMKMDRILSAF